MKRESPADQPLVNRYLQLLKSSLLDDLYLENEARLLYIFSMIASGRAVDTNAVREIGSRLPELIKGVRSAREEGKPWWKVEIQNPNTGTASMANMRNVCEFAHSMIGRKRMENIERCLDGIRLDGVPGDLIETGVWRGGATIFMRGYLAAYGMDDRSVWVADSFAGLPKPSLPEDKGYDFSPEHAPILAVSLDEVKDTFARYGLLDENVRFLKGWFRDTLPDAPIERLALLRLDGDLYESTMDALNVLYSKLEPGGYIIIDDYGDFEPCRRAVTEFREGHQITETIQTIDWTGVYWRKEQI